MGITAAIRAIAALIIVAITAGGLWYVMNLRADLAIREANERVLKDGIEEQKQLIERMRADVAAIQRANAALNDTIRRQQDDVLALTRKFSQDAQGNSRDFGAFAAEKPALVERLVNRGTVNAYRCLELASGAAHTPEELAARNSSEINRECPTIANPNYRPGTEVRAATTGRALPAEAKTETVPAASQPASAAGTPARRPPPPTIPNRGVK